MFPQHGAQTRQRGKRGPTRSFMNGFDDDDNNNKKLQENYLQSAHPDETPGTPLCWVSTTEERKKKGNQLKR